MAYVRFIVVVLCVFSQFSFLLSDSTIIRKAKNGGRLILHPSRDVCYSEQIPSRNLSFPVVWTDGTFCQHQTLLKRKCCHGYEVFPFEKGCPVVSAVQDTFSEAFQNGGKKFTFLAKKQHFERYLTESFSQAYTLLYPHDNGFHQEFDEETNNELLRRVRLENRWQISPFFLYHLLPRKWHVNHLYHLQELPTMLSPYTIVVSKIKQKMILFNCVPALLMNVHSRDGILHQLTRPLPPRYARTLADVLASHPQLSMFRNLVGYADLLSKLRHEGPLTLLVPTNEALERLPKSYLDSITYDKKYMMALQALVLNHLVDGLICSLELQVKTSIKTLEKEKRYVKCNKDLTVSVGQAQITVKDVITQNGVIHYLDRVLLPPKALSLAQITREIGASLFIDLCRTAGIHRDLTSRGPYTIFAPTDKALRELKPYVLNDTSALHQLLLHHIVEGLHTSYTLKDNAALKTLATAFDNMPFYHERLKEEAWKHWLRIRIYNKRVTVGDAVVLSGDKEAFNGFVHLIDKVLIPAEKSIGQVLLAMEGVNRFLGMMKKSKGLLQEVLHHDGPFTLILVTDEDMDRWVSDLFTYYRILGDKQLLNKTMNAHILDTFIMPRGLIDETHFKIESRLGPSHPLSMTSKQGSLSLRHSSIKPHFIMCSNGVILFADSLIMPV